MPARRCLAPPLTARMPAPPWRHRRGADLSGTAPQGRAASALAAAIKAKDTAATAVLLNQAYKAGNRAPPEGPARTGDYQTAKVLVSRASASLDLILPP